MASSHGKDTVLIIGGTDISAYVTKSVFDRGADEHDITGYGKQSHVVRGGLRVGSLTFEGWYDTSAGTGPRAVLRPLLGTVTTYDRRVEGTGTGRPKDAGSGHLKKYVETNPVNDIVTWSAEMTLSDDVTSSVQ